MRHSDTSKALERPLRQWFPCSATIFSACAMLALLLLAPDTARAGESLQQRVKALIEQSNLSDAVGVAVADTLTGRTLVTHRAERPLNPASNMKLVTAATALSELGADFTMRTGLYGTIEGDAVEGGLYLKGYGDPDLQLADLIVLARDLADQGVRSVDEVVVDGSYFDGQILPPAFDQQPEEAASFRAGVSAIAVDRGAFLLRVRPGRAAGEPARVALDGPGYFALDNAMTTAAGGTPSVVAIQRAEGDRMALLLRGKVPLGVRLLSYRRRVENPLIYAGHAMVDALRSAGIQAPERVSVRTMPGGLAMLASHESPPLSVLITAMGKISDNFTAEMLLKVIGAERKTQPGTSQGGAEVAAAFLQRVGVPQDQATIVNGSGLFEGNRISAAALSQLLVHMYRDTGLRAEYLHHLAVGGVDGTLSRRLDDLPRPRIVRAKTGTLNQVIALSGYVLGPEPNRAYTFSVLANGVYGKHHAARTLADDVVKAIADHLHPE